MSISVWLTAVSHYLSQRWPRTHLCGEHFLCSFQVSGESAQRLEAESPPSGSGTETIWVTTSCNDDSDMLSWREPNVDRFFQVLTLMWTWEGQAAFSFSTSRCQTYIVVAERSWIFDVESVNVLLKEAEQRQVQSGQSGLVALEETHRRCSGEIKVGYKVQTLFNPKFTKLLNQRGAKRDVRIPELTLPA